MSVLLLQMVFTAPPPPPAETNQNDYCRFKGEVKVGQKETRKEGWRKRTGPRKLVHDVVLGVVLFFIIVVKCLKWIRLK